MKPLRLLISLALAGHASVARAEAFTTRRGGVGFLDVPAAETLGPGAGVMALDTHLQLSPGEPPRFAPFPLTVAVGLTGDLDFALALREGGMPSDPSGVPLWSLTLKYALLRARGHRPGVGFDFTVDRLNFTPESSLRVMASTRAYGPARASAFVGAELTRLEPSSFWVTGGAAVAVRHRSGLEGVFEGLYSTRAAMLGAGARYALTKSLGVSAGVTWLPGQSAVRLSLGLSIFVGTPRVEEAPEDTRPAVEPTGPTRKAAAQRGYLDDRPRFRLKVRPAPRVPDEAGRHLQFGPTEPGDGEDDEDAPPPPPAEPQQTPDIPGRGARK